MPDFRRTSRGRFEASTDTRERDAQVASLCGLGHSRAELAEQFGVSVRAIGQMRDRAYAIAGRELREQALATELAKLDGYEQAALAVLHSEHVTVSQGKVIVVDGVPLADDGPVLAALDRLDRIVDRRSKLLGLYAPTRQTVTVLTEDVVDAALREAAEEHARLTADPARSTA